jgi:hypothetical protein
MEQIIYLEIDDDILSVRDRLRRTQSKHVVLVVPPRCQALREPLDFRLLRRQAAALDLDLALVFDNAKLRDVALEEGLTVFSRLSLGRRVVRRRKRWQSRDRPGVEGVVARLKRDRLKWWHWVLGPIAIALVLGVLAWGVIMVWPSATVYIVPAKEHVGVSVWVEADTAQRMVDWDQYRMPARVVQIEVVDRGEVETTGITNVAAERAVGVVLLVNITDREVRIPVDTIVSTSAGTPVRFRTLEPVTVAPRGRVRAPVEALEGGPSGNVRSYLINRVEGTLAASLNVTNDAPTTGGTNDQAHRVTHGDKQRVSDLLIEKLIEKGHAELSDLLEDEFLPIETMWINQYTIRTNYDRHVDDVADKLALEMRATVGGVAISEETAQEIAYHALSRQVRDGFHLLPETVHISRGDTATVDPETGRVRFLMDGVALMKVDVDVPTLQRAIRGRSIDEALAYMRETLPTEVEPSLVVQPDWMIRVPWLVFRIAVVEQELGREVTYALYGS